MIWILRMKMNQASCAGEAYAGFGFGTGIKRRPASQVQSPTTDETVLIEDLIDALREKERMIAELKQRQLAGCSASVLAAWRRRFAALVVSSARPTVEM